MTLDSRGREAIATWLTLAAIVVLCLPTLVFSYLPMTDLPQHLAVASILEHHDDARFGFAEHYVVDWWRTPYVLPYALCLAFGKLMPLELAMHVVVFLSVIAYPLAVLALLRVAGKPAWFALLAVPLVYNRAFFWGFINFNLSLGLALAAFALYASAKKSVVRDVVQALLVLAATLCHVYGLALIAALVGAFAVAGGYASLRSRPWSVLPILAGMVLWLVGAREQAGYTPLDPHLDPTFGERLLDFPYSLLGGYQDRSQLGLLVLFVFSFALLAWPSLPTSLARLRALTPLVR